MADLILEHVIEAGILIFEFIGAGILIYTCLISFYKFMTGKPDVQIYLGKGLAMGLEFNMGSEILRTVLAQSWEEFGLIGGIIILRVALVFLIHWEISEEKKEKAAPHEDAGKTRQSQ